MSSKKTTLLEVEDKGSTIPNDFTIVFVITAYSYRDRSD
jgi:hypothetical protein